MTVNVSAIPDELRGLRQWIVWTQPDKVPFCPRTGEPAKSTDPATWGSLDDALAAMAFGDARYAGVGFVFTDDDPYCGIDLDDCLDSNGVPYPSALRLVTALASYTEVSPSGRGLKVIVKGKKPGVRCKRPNLKWAEGAIGQVEMYDTERYFTITGAVIPDAPVEIASRQAEVDQVYAKLFPPPKRRHRIARPSAPGAVDRCRKYLEKCPDSISGDNGHDKALRAACECFRFGLSDSEAREMMSWWSEAKSGGEPWTDKEIDHKIESARAKVEEDGETGCRLDDDSDGYVPWDCPRPPTGASADVVARVGAIKRGEYRSVGWFAPMLSKLSQSLLPGTVTVVCGDPGAGKSYFMLSAARGWMEEGVPFAIFELEEDRTYHLQRYLAMLAGDSRFVDIEWVRSNADAVEVAIAEHKSALDALGRAITDAPESRVSLQQLADWYEQVADSSRVVVIDPVTAASAGKDRYVEDGAFMARVKGIARESGTSLILVTHPRIGKKRAISLDDLAGGADYPRFAQTVMVIADCDDSEEVQCRTPLGRITVTRNRVVHLRKARNGRGGGSDIAFTFSPKDLGFVEHGVIVRD